MIGAKLNGEALFPRQRFGRITSGPHRRRPFPETGVGLDQTFTGSSR